MGLTLWVFWASLRGFLFDNAGNTFLCSVTCSCQSCSQPLARLPSCHIYTSSGCKLQIQTWSHTPLFPRQLLHRLQTLSCLPPDNYLRPKASWHFYSYLLGWHCQEWSKLNQDDIEKEENPQAIFPNALLNLQSVSPLKRRTGDHGSNPKSMTDIRV